MKLIGRKSNRAAIGARIKVTVATPTGNRTIYKTVNSGGSFGANPLRQEIGLGEAKMILAVEVFWRASGLRQSFTALQVNQAYFIEEGNTNAAVLPLKRLPLSPAGATPVHHHHSDHK